MVNYICPRCHIDLKRKGNFNFHINRKFPCVPVLAKKTDIEIVMEKLKIQDEELQKQKKEIIMLKEKLNLS